MGLSADFSYRRHTDEFILLVQSPSVYENNHIDSLWQADLRRITTPHPNIELAYGLEADGDAIRSNSLGRHARNQGAGYANVSMRSLRRLTLSVGARQEIFAGPTPVFSPSASAGYDLSHGLRLHAAYRPRLPPAYLCRSLLRGPYYHWQFSAQAGDFAKL